MTQKKLYCLVHCADIQGRVPHWATRVGLKNGLLVQTLQGTIWMVTKTANGPILALQSQHQPIQGLQWNKNARNDLEKS